MTEAMLSTIKAEEEIENKNIKISILICTYNRKQLLKKAIDSILNQSFPADEIIVLDGGSTDGTNELIAKYNNIRLLVVNERDTQGCFVGSLAHSINIGFKSAKNEYIFLLADDIVMLPDCMEIMMRDISLNPNFSAWACKFGETEDKFIYGLYNDSLILNMGVINKKFYNKAGRFDEKYGFYGWDIDFSLQFWHKGFPIFPSSAGLLHYYAPNEIRSDKKEDVERLKNKFPSSKYKYEHLPFEKLPNKFKPNEFHSEKKEKAAKDQFLSYEYLRHNYRRMEHLSSLNLDIKGLSILELGAGIGDLTSYFLDRQCMVLSIDARVENVKLLYERYCNSPYQNLKAEQLDLDDSNANFKDTYDVVFCYGTLYHLKKPAKAIELMAKHCSKYLLLETCVSFGNEDEKNIVLEPVSCPSQAYSGIGCRPTRSWVYNRLKQYFDFVYIPVTQPNDEQFPTDWTAEELHRGNSRAIFIASREKINNPLLVEELIMHQKRH